MKVELDVYDRLVLLNILPKQGTYLNLKMIRKLREDLSFSEEEHKELDFKVTKESGEERYDWDPNKVRKVCIDIPNPILSIIEGSLVEMEKRGELIEEFIPVYEKFIIENPT